MKCEYSHITEAILSRSFGIKSYRYGHKKTSWIWIYTSRMLIKYFANIPDRIKIDTLYLVKTSSKNMDKNLNVFAVQMWMDVLDPMYATDLIDFEVQWVKHR